MLTEMPTEEMISKWKRVYSEYRGKLKPNRKSSYELVEYLKNSYPLKEMDDRKFENMVTEEMMENDFSMEKLEKGKTPRIVSFKVLNIGDGERLYKKQDKIFKGLDIIIGIDMETGYFHIEGSSILYDELFKFRGLDEQDLSNYFLVYEYVKQMDK